MSADADLDRLLRPALAFGDAVGRRPCPFDQHSWTELPG